MFKGKKYLDSQNVELNDNDKPIIFDWDQKMVKFNTGGGKGGNFNHRQRKILEDYMNNIQSDKWVIMYHKSHCCVGVTAIVIGVLLFFTVILAILLIGVGIYIIIEKEKYFEFVFRKMLIIFQNTEAIYKPMLVRQGIGSRLIYNKSKKEKINFMKRTRVQRSGKNTQIKPSR